MFKRKTLESIMKDELEYAKLQLLQMQSRKEYYSNMENFYLDTIKRLEQNLESHLQLERSE